MNDDQSWKNDRIEAIKDSINFFSNSKKFEREKWVVSRLLEQFIPNFDESLLKPAEEPVDVQFKNANFQVKEVLQTNRRRGDEYKKSLSKVESAEKIKDLFEKYSPKDITLDEIISDCINYSEKLLIKYGPEERKNIDLVCYHNFDDTLELKSEYNKVYNLHFRSFSVVSNEFRVVVYARESAPDFLIKQVGIVRSFQSGDY